MLAIAAELGHGVQTFERYYARIFADYDRGEAHELWQARAEVAGRVA